MEYKFYEIAYQPLPGGTPNQKLTLPTLLHALYTCTNLSQTPPKLGEVAKNGLMRKCEADQINIMVPLMSLSKILKNLLVRYLK